MWQIRAKYLLPNALKTCPKSNKLLNLVTLEVMLFFLPLTVCVHQHFLIIWCGENTLLVLNPNNFKPTSMQWLKYWVTFCFHNFYFQLSHLFANWEVIYTEANFEENIHESSGLFYQPIHILEKPTRWVMEYQSSDGPLKWRSTYLFLLHWAGFRLSIANLKMSNKNNVFCLKIR